MDRAYAFFNQAGRTVNAKKYPTLQQLRCTYDVPIKHVTFVQDTGDTRFNLQQEPEKIATFMSEYLQEEVTLKENLSSGFPDDDKYNGPTVVSTHTFEALQRWFPKLSLANLRLRFRANIELGDCPVPFWEDRLFAAPGADRPFRIGRVDFLGKQACARCAVPARDPLSGEKDQSFMAEFIRQREESLPSFAHQDQFDHYYRLCVNTVIPRAARTAVLTVDDELHL